MDIDHKCRGGVKNYTFWPQLLTGGCWVHHWCAMWSEGVKLTEKDELENVDKAVISGTQRVSASVLHVYYEASGTIEFGLTTFRFCFFFSLPFFCTSFANTAKGWVQPFDAMLRAAHGSTTSLARQPVDPSSP